MNLIIDIGNTRIKLAVFKDAALEELVHATKDSVLNEISTLLVKYPSLKKAIVSSVGNVPEAALELLNERFDLVQLDSETRVPFQNTYSNQYLGGAISPGVMMRYKALHTFTANLPLLTPTLPIKTIGDSTEAAIQSGVLFGIAQEIDGYIAFWREQFPDFTIILTGGDAHLLRDSLKNSIFAHPNFLLEGLLHILQHNT